MKGLARVELLMLPVRCNAITSSSFNQQAHRSTVEAEIHKVMTLEFDELVITASVLFIEFDMDAGIAAHSHSDLARAEELAKKCDGFLLVFSLAEPVLSHTSRFLPSR